MSCTFRGALLAGGRSRRLGRDKALLRLGGETLIARAARALVAVADEVAIVGAGQGDYSSLGLPVIADERPGLGPLGGIHAALGGSPHCGILVLACDLPFAGEPLLRYLAELACEVLRAKGGDSPRAWVPEQDGRLQPLCAVYSSGCREIAAEALNEGPGSVHSLLSRIGVVEVQLTPSLPFYRPELLLNVNRPRDLERATAALAARSLEAV